MSELSGDSWSSWCPSVSKPSATNPMLTCRCSCSLGSSGAAHRETRSISSWARDCCHSGGRWGCDTTARAGDSSGRASICICFARIRSIRRYISRNWAGREGRAERLRSLESAWDLGRPQGSNAVVGGAISCCKRSQDERCGDGVQHGNDNSEGGIAREGAATIC